MKKIISQINLFFWKRKIQKTWFCIRINTRLITNLIKPSLQEKYPQQNDESITKIASVITQRLILDQLNPSYELFYKEHDTLIETELKEFLKNETIKRIHLQNLLLKLYAEFRIENSEKILKNATELDKNVKPLTKKKFKNIYKKTLDTFKDLVLEEELEKSSKLPKTTKKQWLRIITNFSGLGATFSFICSIIYDWGYFHAIGLTFSDIPSTFTDHLRATLLWLPLVLTGLGAYAIIELITKRIEQGKTEEEIIKDSKNPELVKKFRESPYKLTPILIFIAIIEYFLVGDIAIGFLLFALPTLWMSVALWINDHPRILARRDPVIRLFIIFLPAIFIYLGLLGYDEGKKLIYKEKKDTTINLKNSKTPFSVILIRHFEKGILIKIPSESKFKFIKWDDISEITITRENLIYKGILGGLEK